MARPTKSMVHLAAEELRERLRVTNTAKQFGFVLDDVAPGRAVLKMEVDDRHKQVHGVVHGGVLAALADTAGGLATYMAVPRGQRVATIEMKINYLEAVGGGTATADARVVRLGRHIAVVDCDVRIDDGTLVCKALMTFFVGPFPDEKGDGKNTEKDKKKRHA